MTPPVGIAFFGPLHPGFAAIAHEHPTSNHQGASRLAIQQQADTLLEHSMNTMDRITVDRWRPKLATDLSAHVLTILGKVDQRVRPLSRSGPSRGTGHVESTRFCSDTFLHFNFHNVCAIEVWVCLRKLSVTCTMQLCTSRNDCVHFDLVRPWLFRSSIEVVKPISRPVATKRDVEHLKHHNRGDAPTHMRADFSDGCDMPFEHTKSDVGISSQ